MATITLKGSPVHTVGDLPALGSPAPDFTLTGSDLSDVTSASLRGKRLVLNIFPSIDTSTCATSVRSFNAKAGEMTNTLVLCISRDLPFAQSRFCGAEGLQAVQPLSDFRYPGFAEVFGVGIVDGKLKGLFARAVLVLDEQGVVIHRELVPEIADEPDYTAVLSALEA
ncbi:MAG: thiol peroxidase [Planctomycetota bacterium]|nr:MAG: thiol peroxidase [Planctomycetota bacterium]